MSTVRKYQPHYTVEEYRQWSGDWELWYGTAVAMTPSPFGPHERTVTAIAFQIQKAIQTQSCACSVYTGLDWIVHSDTVVRPDVMVVCGEQPEKYLERSPVLTVEVLSESTSEKDRYAKRDLYERNQVEHYLIVDHSVRSITWLELQSNGTYKDVSDHIPEDGKFTVVFRSGCVIPLDREAVFI